MFVSSSDYQRQWRQKVELLKKKILQLTRDENNQDLSKCATQQNAVSLLLWLCLLQHSFDIFYLSSPAQEIFKLQAEVDRLRLLMTNAKKTTDARIKGEQFYET